MQPARSSSRLLQGTVLGAVICVAACSGGGVGGSTSPATPGSLSSSSPTSTPAASIAQQRSAAASALSAASAAVDYGQFGTSNTVALFALAEARKVEARSLPATSAAPACQHGIEYSYSTAAPGTLSFSIQYFFDSKCTSPYKTIELSVTPSASGGSANGSEEVFGQDGSVLDYKAYVITFANGSNGRVASISVQKTIAAAPSASPFASSGYACAFAAAGSNATTCGSGNVIALPAASPSPLSIGFIETNVSTIVAPSPAPSATATPGSALGVGELAGTLQVQISGSGYTGPLGGLTLVPAQLPGWSITGGKQVASLSGTATFGFGTYGGGDYGSAVASSVNIMLTDSSDALTALLSSSGNTLTGTIANGSGQTVATVMLDLSGSGTIAYNDGSTGTIKDWIILG